MNCKKSLAFFVLVSVFIFLTISCSQVAEKSGEQSAAAKTRLMLVTPDEEAFILKMRLILENVKTTFPDTLPSDKEFGDTALAYLPQILDRHSMYLTADETTLMNQDNEGSFGGIGIQGHLAPAAAEVEGRAVFEVITVKKKTPAELAGLQKGDRIIAVDGAPIEPNTTRTMLRIRGPLGSNVKLTVVRPGSPTPLQFTLTRANIIDEEAHLSYSVNGGVSVIKLPVFTETVGAEFEAAVPDILAKGATSLILDLRGNPGGNLEVCRAVASFWTDHQQIVAKIKDRTRTEIKQSLPTKSTFAGKKTAVLVNEDSASCSEVVAGALQDWRAAKIIGTVTFGKGLVQHLIPFPDGSTLIVTSAVWLTPNERQINKWGITPDILVGLTREDVKAGRDPQMAGAREFLKTGKWDPPLQSK